MRSGIAASILLALALGCSSKRPIAPGPATPSAATLQQAAKAPTEIAWQPWSDDIFVRATKENRIVLLDLGAVWCHWCHVMEETTYRDPLVIKLINERYLPVRVDQDARPDLSNRYEDYGWPATIVFDPKGQELAKRRGYIPPLRMSSMLQAIIDDPTPGPSIQAETPPRAADTPALTDAQKKEMLSRLNEVYDPKQGGWGTVHKFVDADVIEYLTTQGDAKQQEMARTTLTHAIKLIDPAWGGVYQYSTDGDWVHPHFEKIMQYQADDLRAYARAYARYGDAAYLKAAEDIHRFLRNFFTSPSGAFYTSQDADRVAGEHGGEYFSLDDAARRAKGIPRIDQNIYARENGWAIEALVTLYGVTGDPETLEQATAAAGWVLAHRKQSDGLFRHGEHDAAGPYVSDTLAMGRAFLALYTATAERVWLDEAVAATSAIAAHFTSKDGGFATAVVKVSDPLPPKPQVDENISLARFANLLYGYTGNKQHRAVAETAMKYVASSSVIQRRGWTVGGLLLADAEFGGEPMHVSIVGKKSDTKARLLFMAGLKYPKWYKRLDWVDAGEAPLPNTQVEYPALPEAAAFLCTNGACSAPVQNAAALTSLLEKRH